MKRERNYRLFEDEYWMFRHYDGRRKEFRGWNKAEFYAAQRKNYERHLRNTPGPQFIYEYRRREIAYFATVPYEYQGDGMDDYNKYQRPESNCEGYVAICPGERANNHQKPASNCVGYVAICPGERANNHYVDDPILVAYLTKKYNKHFANK